MAEGRVLIVDDEEDVRKTVKSILSKANVDVIEAADGAEGIQLIQSGDNPLALDTVICDLDMPNVHGTEAIAFFRSQFPSVPIIILTRNPEITHRQKSAPSPIVLY